MDIPHDNRNSQLRLRLLTVAHETLILGSATALDDIPRRTELGEAGIGIIGRGLGVDAVGPDSGEAGVEEEADNGQEEVHDEHDAFDEEEEHGEDGDDDVVVGQTV